VDVRAIAQYQYAALILPLRVWGFVWITIGVVCLISAFRRRDSAAFAAAVSIKIAWALLSLGGWMLGDLPRGHVSAVVWVGFAGLVAVIASWPEPTPMWLIRSAVPQAVISADANGRIVAWNLEAARLFGWRAPEVYGKPLTVLIPPELRQQHLDAFARAAREKHSAVAGQVMKLTALHRNGTKFPIALTISVWTDDGDDGAIFTGLIRDLSSKRAPSPRGGAP
jgi:PAS domain S-box-containing protein